MSGWHARGMLALTLVVGSGCSSATDLSAPPVVPTPRAVPVDSVRSVDLAPGVRHTFRWEVAGPWAIHVAEVDLAACGIGLRTVKALDHMVGRETTTQLVARVAARVNRPVYAGINGDYFSFNPDGYLVGTQVSDGEPLRGYTNRPVFGTTATLGTFFGTDQLTGTVRSRRGVGFEMRRVNEPPDTLRVSLYNRFIGATTLADEGAVEVVVRIASRAAGIGDTVRAVVQAIDTLRTGVGIPSDGVVLAGAGRGAAYLRANMSVGDTVSWVMRFPGASAAITEMLAGDPHLLRAGNSLAPFTGTVAAERHPRTAVGVTSDRKLLLVTVDGRQSTYSAGMTLDELTALMRRLGSREALNLDGGGSTTMVIGSRYVNRPSDAAGERRVANALVVVGPAAGTCR